MITHLMSDDPKRSNLCDTWITGDNFRDHAITYDVNKADCENCVSKYNKITSAQPFSKVADAHYADIDNEMVFLLEDGRMIVINVRDLSGPGCWCRVLWQLELQGGKDLDHLMLPDYTWTPLVGDWHY